MLLNYDTISSEDLHALGDWLRGKPQLTMGPLTQQFEEEWAAAFKSAYAVYVNSGSSALLLMLACLDLPRGAKVVVPGLGWSTDLSSVMHLDLCPVLCDCYLTDLSVDFNQLEHLFKRENPHAFILVEVLGLVPDLHAIKSLCKRYGVVFLETLRSPMAAAMTYMLNQWDVLNHYVEQGYLNIDNNAAERALKRVAIGRKNWLFAGHDQAGESHARLCACRCYRFDVACLGSKRPMQRKG